jgi:pyruvyl transferase EpsO
MLELRERLDAVAAEIGPGPVVYLDVPVYFNLGDLLIHRGTEALLARHGIEVRLRQSLRDFDPARIRRALRSPDGTILLQGGGNFGDLYPQHQLLRERILESFPEHRVIVLPQTAYFHDAGAQRRSAAVFRRHPRLTLLARDARTAALLEEFSGSVALVPDMAHALYPLAPPAAPRGSGSLAVWRRDGEARAHPDIDPRSGVDWEDLVDASARRQFRWVRHLLRRGGWRGRLGHGLWERVEQELIRRAAEVYLRHERVATSRLHGHILACLLDLPSRVYENSYGKLGAYVAAWTRVSPLVEVAGEAAALAAPRAASR